MRKVDIRRVANVFIVFLKHDLVLYILSLSGSKQDYKYDGARPFAIL